MMSSSLLSSSWEPLPPPWSGGHDHRDQHNDPQPNWGEETHGQASQQGSAPRLGTTMESTEPEPTANGRRVLMELLRRLVLLFEVFEARSKSQRPPPPMEPCTWCGSWVVARTLRNCFLCGHNLCEECNERHHIECPFLWPPPQPPAGSDGDGSNVAPGTMQPRVCACCGVAHEQDTGQAPCDVCFFCRRQPLCSGCSWFVADPGGGAHPVIACWHCMGPGHLPHGPHEQPDLRRRL